MLYGIADKQTLMCPDTMTVLDQRGRAQATLSPDGCFPVALEYFYLILASIKARYMHFVFSFQHKAWASFYWKIPTWASMYTGNNVKICCLFPCRWGLNPKMHALQTQPTVSPTCVHHIQRGEIKVMPNVQVRAVFSISMLISLWSHNKAAGKWDMHVT